MFSVYLFLLFSISINKSQTILYCVCFTLNYFASQILDQKENKNTRKEKPWLSCKQVMIGCCGLLGPTSQHFGSPMVIIYFITGAFNLFIIFFFFSKKEYDHQHFVRAHILVRWDGVGPPKALSLWTRGKY